tara:strand:- start:565 stop:2070 length:1506 start_codon:yes stop_codon:yes gene_type:complete
MEGTMTQPSAASSPQPSQIPDLIKIGAVPSSTEIDVETSILEPVTFSQSEATFILQNKGLLHSNSKITLSVTTPTGHSASNGFYPLGCGVNSLVRRAVLRVGGKEICSTDDFAHLAGYTSTFISSENNRQREQVLTSRGVAHDIYYRNGSDEFTGDAESDTGASYYGLQLGKEIRHMSVSGTLHENLKLHPWQLVKHEPVFQLNLSDLFPALRTIQLPLFMMKEQVSLQLLWTDVNPAAGLAGSRRCCLGHEAGHGAEYDIKRDQVKVIADYIYYPQDMMESYAQQNSTMDFTYSDYELSKRTLTLASATNQVWNVGGNSKIVNKVVTMVSSASEGEGSILNRYHSLAPLKTYTGTVADRFNGSLKTNVKYNNEFLYPVDRDNNAVHFSDVIQTEGAPMFVTREEYSNEGDTITPQKFESLHQNGSGANLERGLSGRFYYQGYRLNKGERVNTRGIEVYQDYSSQDGTSADLPEGPLEWRAYLEVIKFARLQDGIMTTSFA